MRTRGLSSHGNLERVGGDDATGVFDVPKEEVEVANAGVGGVYCEEDFIVPTHLIISACQVLVAVRRRQSESVGVANWQIRRIVHINRQLPRHYDLNSSSRGDPIKL